MFSHSYAFLEASHKSDVISLSVHHIRAYMMLICLIIGDINFDQGGAGFLHSKVIIFSFVIDQFLGGGILRYYANILFPLRFSPTDFSIHQWLCLQNYYHCVYLMALLYFSHSSHIY